MEGTTINNFRQIAGEEDELYKQNWDVLIVHTLVPFPKLLCSEKRMSI
jgi:hypothetical protein